MHLYWYNEVILFCGYAQLGRNPWQGAEVVDDILRILKFRHMSVCHLVDSGPSRS